MPLLARDIGYLNEEPLTGSVFHGGFSELNLHCVVGMFYDFEDSCVSPSTDLTIESLAQVESTSYQFPSPSFISYAVIPERFPGEWRIGFDSVANEAICCVCIHSQQEWNKEVMCIPECLK